MSISVDMARRVLEACKQRARELRSPVSIAIVDGGGHLVLFERMMAPYGWATGNISIAKATTAVMFNQPTDAVAQWASGIPGFASSLASMTEGKFIMAAGGWPIRSGGTTIGGVGVSGGNAPGRDDEIARAGLAVVEGIPPAYASPVAQQPYMPGTNTPTPQPMQPPTPYSGVAPMQQPGYHPQPAHEGELNNSTRHLAPDQDNYGAETLNS
ncbi:MAG TPA: heme-binding protein [Ktedonobacteraceae bacterium]